MRIRYWIIVPAIALWVLPAQAQRISRSENAIGGGFGFQAGMTDWSPGGFKWFNEYSRKLGRLLWLDFQANLVGGDMNDRHCWRDNKNKVKCEFGNWDGNAVEFVAGVKLRWPLKKLPLVIDAKLAGAADILLLGSNYIGISPSFRGGIGAYWYLVSDFGVGPGITANFGPAFISDGPGVQFYATMDFQVLGVEYRF